MTMRAGNGMKVWGNEVTLSRLWVDLTQLAPPPYDALYVVNCDGWDGYPSHKADLKYHDHDAQGYATATVTAAQMVVTFNKVKPLNADGTAPDAPLLKRTRITVAAGSLVPVIADNV